MDLQELIPEFFSDESFLVNAKHLDLGTRRKCMTLGCVSFSTHAVKQRMASWSMMLSCRRGRRCA
jgi:hypothetical protein